MQELRRALGTPALTFYGIGVILGAGIYSILGAAAEPAGEGLWLAFALAAVVALLTGLSYAELATMYPKAAAEYVYLGHAFPRRRRLAAVIGYVLTGASIATAATVSLAFAGYLASMTDVPRWAGAAGLILIMTAVNIVGIRQASGVNIVFTLIEAAGLLIVIAIGSLQENFGAALAAPVGLGVLPAAALVFFAYLGFEDIANLAEETKEPARSLPWALMLAIGISTLLYVLVALASLALLSPAELAASEAPLRDALQAASPRWAGAVGAIALFATANTALVGLIVASRIMLGMARGGDLPKGLAKVLPTSRTPWAGALVAFVGALLLLPLREPALVGSVAAFGALVAFIGVNAAVVALRRRNPKVPRPFRVPLAIRGVPVLPVLGILTSVGLILQLEDKILLFGTIALVVAGLVHAVTAPLRRPRKVRLPAG